MSIISYLCAKYTVQRPDLVQILHGQIAQILQTLQNMIPLTLYIYVRWWSAKPDMKSYLFYLIFATFSYIKLSILYNFLDLIHLQIHTVVLILTLRIYV